MKKEVYGLELKEHGGGCKHYASPLDIIAIKFKCCGTYYACYSCHEALADHPAERWTPEEFTSQAILCCCCGHEMSITQYFSCKNVCIHCSSPLNSKCALHWDLYFNN